MEVASAKIMKSNLSFPVLNLQHSPLSLRVIEVYVYYAISHHNQARQKTQPLFSPQQHQIAATAAARMFFFSARIKVKMKWPSFSLLDVHVLAALQHGDVHADLEPGLHVLDAVGALEERAHLHAEAPHARGALVDVAELAEGPVWFGAVAGAGYWVDVWHFAAFFFASRVSQKNVFLFFQCLGFQEHKEG